MTYDILLATKDSKVGIDIKRAISHAKLQFKLIDVISRLNTISTVRNKMNELILLDLKLPNEDFERFMFYLNQRNDEIPIILLTKMEALKGKIEVLRNLPIYDCIESSSNEKQVLSMLENFIKLLDVDMDKKFARVEYLKKENVFVCTFKNMETFFLSRKNISEDDGSEVVSAKIDKKGYFIEVKLKSGKEYELVWDFVRHMCDESYEYHISKIQQGHKISPEEIGNRIYTLRKQKNMTQDDLELRTSIKRANISRIESGKHYPNLETLEKIAGAFEIPVAQLIVK